MSMGDTETAGATEAHVLLFLVVRQIQALSPFAITDNGRRRVKSRGKSRQTKPNTGTKDREKDRPRLRDQWWTS